MQYYEPIIIAALTSIIAAAIAVLSETKNSLGAPSCAGDSGSDRRVSPETTGDNGKNGRF